MGSADRPPFRVAIALGSNLGSREEHLRAAVGALQGPLASVRLSSFHETAPVGVGDQPAFLNAAAVGETEKAPLDLLRLLLEIEVRGGRERPYPGAPRTIDLDLILYDDVVIETAELVLPHPRFRERRFVLEPLAELAADWRDPVTGRTVAELLSSLTA